MRTRMDPTFEWKRTSRRHPVVRPRWRMGWVWGGSDGRVTKPVREKGRLSRLPRRTQSPQTPTLGLSRGPKVLEGKGVLKESEPGSPVLGSILASPESSYVLTVSDPVPTPLVKRCLYRICHRFPYLKPRSLSSILRVKMTMVDTSIPVHYIRESRSQRNRYVTLIMDPVPTPLLIYPNSYIIMSCISFGRHS